VSNLPPASSPPAIGPDCLPVATVPPPRFSILYGYIGDAFSYGTYPDNDTDTDRDFLRLYRTLLLNEYLELRTADIYYVALLSSASPISLNVVWLKPDAVVRYVYTNSMQAQQTSFLQGPIAGGHAGGFGGGGYGGGGYGGGGGTSFACPGGGTSFACPGGGTSFACPGGGTSFACPGGGTSFACPGGGTSFACPGGGTSFACPGGGVSFGWCG
jgi:hypothetical protein